MAIGERPIYSQDAANPNTYKPYDLPVEFKESLKHCVGNSLPKSLEKSKILTAQV